MNLTEAKQILSEESKRFSGWKYEQFLDIEDGYYSKLVKGPSDHQYLFYLKVIEYTEKKSLVLGLEFVVCSMKNKSELLSTSIALQPGSGWSGKLPPFHQQTRAQVVIVFGGLLLILAGLVVWLLWRFIF